MVTITINMRAQDAAQFLRGIVRDLDGCGLEGIGLAMPDWSDALVEVLPGSLPEGRPRKTDDDLLQRYEQFLAARKNPAHGAREFARRMGAKTDPEIRAVVAALRRAGVARNPR
jgi:hypothetical protein